MSRIVAQFDPSAQAGSFSAAAVNRCSALLFMNESANFLTLDFGGAFPSTILQPWSNRLIRLAQPVQTVNWTVAATLASASAPVSQVYVEAFDPSETLDGITSGPLFRQTNVGNSVNTNVTTPSSIAQDVLTPFVVGPSSLVATKDGSAANRLDVAGGVAWLLQSDGSLGRQAPTATFFLTVQVNSTYYLDLNPDGSWSFATNHSGQAGYLAIAQVTTDASGNIATVTDERQLSTELLGAMGANGSAFVDVQGLGLLAPDLGAGKRASMGHLDNTNGVFSNAVFHNTPMIGASPQGYYFASWNGSATQIPLAIGGDFAGAVAWIGGLGNIGKVGGQASAGNLGVPVIVAQAIHTHVTTVGLTNLLVYVVPVTGLYRVSGCLRWANSSNSAVMAEVGWYDPDSAAAATVTLATPTTGAGAPILLDGSHTLLAGTDFIPFMPITVYAWANGVHAITCAFNDPSGTPNDFVSFIIERLA